MNMKHVNNVIKSAALLTCSVAASTAMAFTADVPDDVEEQAGGFVGLAVGSTPDYEGSDDTETKVAPFGHYRWGSGRYVSVGGTANAESAARIKVNLLTKDTSLELGPVLQYRMKRNGVDNRQVDNMKKVDAATELGAFLGWRMDRFALSTTFVADVSDEHDGSIWYFNGDYDFPINDSFLLNIGAHMTWASDDYMETYFGVDSKNRGSSTLRDYKASSDIKDAGLSLVGQYKFNKTWGMLGLVNYTRLLNDAEDSPLVDDEGDDNQIKMFLAVTYSF
jgi:outer membrane protein